MRLATAFVSGQPHLFIETSEGMVDVHAGIERVHQDISVDPHDVGELLRLGDAGISELEVLRERAGDLEDLVLPLDSLDLAPPVLAPASIVCIGRNYAEHAAEGGDEVPKLPILFSKFPNALVGSGHPVYASRLTDALDYEGELCVVIGRTAHRVQKKNAMSYVAGFTIMNDISARDLQLGDVQWIRGKSLDTFAPLGPLFVTTDEVADVADLRIQTRVNDEIRQDATCRDMVFSIPELLEFITEGITLRAGDLVATGTPAGTGIGHKPPKYMHPGDVVEVTISGIGTLTSPIELEGKAK